MLKIVEIIPTMEQLLDWATGIAIFRPCIFNNVTAQTVYWMQFAMEEPSWATHYSLFKAVLVILGNSKQYVDTIILIQERLTQAKTYVSTKCIPMPRVPVWTEHLHPDCPKRSSAIETETVKRGRRN